jgi:protein-L-isoaspartate(D-aspartate) O-methyltransferase
MVDFQAARRAMVDGQVRTSDVTNLALLAAMLEIPREAFVPESQAGLAYLDRDTPVAAAKGSARALVKPMVLARLVQAADPGPRDRVLIVGCGTGYSAAVMGRLAGEVVALEEDPGLAARARSTLAALGARNVAVIEGPLTGGWPAGSPYDIILVDGGVESDPDILYGQLGSAGRLVAVVTSGPVGKAMLFQSVNGEVSGRVLFDAQAPVLPGFKKTPAFVF